MKLVVRLLLCLTLPWPLACATTERVQDEPLEGVKGRSVLRFEQARLSAFYVPFAFLRFSGRDELARPDIDTGSGFGIRLGLGDPDQAVSLVYTGTRHDEASRNGRIKADAGYLDFASSTELWQDRDWHSLLTVHAGVGGGVVDFERPFASIRGATGQLGARLELTHGQAGFGYPGSIYVGYAAVLWWEPDDAAIYGHEIRLGGEIRF